MIRKHYPMSDYIVAELMYKVYCWVAAGLALIAGTAYLALITGSAYAVFRSESSSIYRAIFNFILFYGLIIATLILPGIVLGSSFIMRMSLQAAIAGFVGYSILTGLTLSSFFFIYPRTSSHFVLALGLAAITFAALSLYSYYANDDFTGIGSRARMALFCIIITIVMNFFMKNAPVDYIISVIIVGAFTFTAARNSQNIKQMGSLLISQGQVANKVAILGAVTIYRGLLGASSTRNYLGLQVVFNKNKLHPKR